MKCLFNALLYVNLVQDTSQAKQPLLKIVLRNHCTLKFEVTGNIEIDMFTILKYQEYVSDNKPTLTFLFVLIKFCNSF